MQSHGMSVRNPGGYGQVRLGVIQRFVDSSGVREGMSQIVMLSGIIWGNRQRGWIERDGIQVPRLTVSRPRAFIGKASQNPKTWLERVRHQSVVNGFTVGAEFVEVLLVFEELHKAGTDLHTLPFRTGYLAGKRLRFL